MINRIFLAVLFVGCATMGRDNSFNSSFSLGDSSFKRKGFYVGADLVYDIAISKSTYSWTPDCDYYLILSYAKENSFEKIVLDEIKNQVKLEVINELKSHLMVYPNFSDLKLTFYKLYGFCSNGKIPDITVPGFSTVNLMDE